MEVLFSTADVHPRERFDYWHSVACDNLVNHASEPNHRTGFEAVMQVGALAGLGLVTFQNSAMRVTRTRAHCNRSESDDLFLCRQTRGKLELQQAGRDVELTPGDMALLDPLQPYAGEFSEASELLVLKLARPALASRIGNTADMVMRQLDGGSKEHGLMSSILEILPAHADNVSRHAAELAESQVLDLAASSLSSAVGQVGRCSSSAQASALFRLRAAIENHLRDPNLSAAVVAHTAGMSVRYGNKLLAPDNQSIMRLVQSRRLERCRRALEDPLQAGRSIGEIAFSWGFSDMTHFGRRFKAAFGMLPSDYRKKVVEPFR